MQPIAHPSLYKVSLPLETYPYQVKQVPEHGRVIPVFPSTVHVQPLTSTSH